ncbi:MAG: class A beta-lactamase [Chitinophagaceae bacterium]
MLRKYSVCFSIITLIQLIACSSLQSPDNGTDQKRKTSLVKAVDSIGSNMKLALYAKELETGNSISVNGDTAMPMQSTFKFPLALAVLHQCEVQNIRLDTSIQILAADLTEDTWSPMRDSLGTKSFRLPLKDLLYFVIACSDNIACDVLFRFCAGPQQVDSFIAKQGYQGIEIHNTEAELHEVWQRQYQNSTSPHAMSDLLVAFYKEEIVNKEHTDYLTDLMLHNKTGDARIRAGVPKGTEVADKTGTCYPENGPGTINDIAIITLPNGNHLALSVYITDAHVDVDQGQAAIANATRLVYGYFTGK